MRVLPTVALLALLVVSLAGCASNDPLRNPGASHSASGSKSGSLSASGSVSVGASGSHSGSGSASASGTGAPAANHAPTANVTATPKNGTAPLNVTLALDGSDADGDALTWSLLFGDGNKTNGTTLPASVKHLYSKGGNFTAELTVSDGHNSTVATTKIPIAAGTVGVAAGLDPNCQRPDAVSVPPAGGPLYYFDNRLPDSQWVYQESNSIPGLQLSQNPGTAPAPVGGPGDIDSLAVQYNCQDGDTLVA